MADAKSLAEEMEGILDVSIVDKESLNHEKDKDRGAHFLEIIGCRFKSSNLK